MRVGPEGIKGLNARNPEDGAKATTPNAERGPFQFGWGEADGSVLRNPIGGMDYPIRQRLLFRANNERAKNVDYNGGERVFAVL